MLGEQNSLTKGISIKLKNGNSCIATWVATNSDSECLHEKVNTEGILSDDEYRGFWVETKLTKEGHMKVSKE